MKKIKGVDILKAKITFNKNFVIDKIDNRLYGSFIEHLGRAVYGGIYEPLHETADDKGFRKDVLELVKEIDVPIVRYPGGNFVSGYNWEDGTGDKSKRPRRMELAWNAIETNEVGIDEFQEWTRRADSSVMMAVNLGTKGADEARNCVEYCNSNTDTYYVNLRRKNGFEDPFNIKVWCLGNEMDGNWQICHKTADEYGRLALETAKLMKMVDPSIELVVSGSSGFYMNTFGEWDMKVLDHTYDLVDYISIHTYYGNGADDTADFLSMSTDMDSYIKAVAAMCDAIKAKKHSKKTVNLSFDEWNVWFHSHEQDKKIEKWQIAPPQLEDIYTFEDALVVGCMLMALQNNCDRVKIACLAQLVNVIAPIMTETGGDAWAQTIYYPFMLGSRYGRGTALKTLVECDTYSTKKHSDVPFVETSVIHNEERKEITVFAVNRSLTDETELELFAENFGDVKLLEHTELYCDDLKAINEKDAQRVKPVNVPVTDSRIVIKKHSWNMLRFGY
ncbi:MAG: alpha-N-arabinofuranosidase [Clostridia bacterium]|nr:alpha-N-arabinofuranosidase [Clostridia bacterium]